MLRKECLNGVSWLNKVSKRNISRVGVIGAGQMGTGIAIVSANTAKYQVTLYDMSAKQIDNAKRFTESWCDKEIKKGRITSEDKNSIFSRLTFSHTASDKEQLADKDLIIEAVSENFDIKKKIFQDLDQILQPQGILATNTSSISITKLASVTKRPEKVIGMHFMNPVPVMTLVEVIRGLQTSDETLSVIRKSVAAMGKVDAISLDRPGFIANRILMPYINEAIFALQEGIATKEDIDTIMKQGTNVPMGPLTLADFIGLDTCLSIMKVLHQELGDTKYRPAPLLVQYVDAGWLGKKTKKGFYTY